MYASTLLRAALAAALFAPALASAHVSYTGRDFGGYGGAGGSLTIANQAVSGNYGWADGLDDDFGDTHKLRAFRFTLTETMEVTLSVAANAAATTTSVGGLLPGFSIYQGLAHLKPLKPDYDYSAGSQAYLDSLGGVPKEGAFRAMNDWAFTNDDNDPLSWFHYRGYAADDNLDGYASGSFVLGPGDYSVFIGGAHYIAQLDSAAPSYGLAATFSAAPVPEAESYAMMLAGLGLVGFAVRRRARA